MTTAYLNRVTTAVPDHDVHPAFVAFADSLLESAPDRRSQALFRRMATRSDIEHRYSVLTPNEASTEFWVNAHEFYRRGSFPETSERMKIFEYWRAARWTSFHSVRSSATPLPTWW